MKTVLTVVGARPQFVKAGPLSRRLREDLAEILVHTGQHYDHSLSATFFEELGLPVPDVDLGVGSAGHAEQTARMTAGIARVIRDRAPDLVIVFGDTNSTLAGALAAARTKTPLAHVEAGLRSFVTDMPEEVNRIASDHLSDLCLCPTPDAVLHLDAEGLGGRARLVGDLMLDACLAARERADGETLRERGFSHGVYLLATVHRAENTDQRGRLAGILEGFARIGAPIVFPVHPRTRAILDARGVEIPPNVTALPPTSYLETVELAANARAVITDSGGLQKEAYFLGIPCVTLRDETEWEETVRAGANVLAGADPERIRRAVEALGATFLPDLEAFGGGRAAERITAEILELLR